MKKIILSVTVVSALMLSACSDFLDVKQNDSITSDALSAENLESLTAPLYNIVWYNFNNNFNLGIGDGMSYNLNHNDVYIEPYTLLNVTGMTSNLQEAWGSFYNVVQLANKVIITVNNVDADESAKTRCIAEARFMRGVAYWYLASLWGDAVISEDPTPLVNNPLVNTNPKKDVFEIAIRDLEFAAKYLPETSSAVGRVNRYSAFGMLSRVYLDYSGFVASNYGENPNVGARDEGYLELARKAAEKVINSGQFKLLDNYPDLFKIEFNNNAESMFAFQWVPGLNGTNPDNYGVTNSTVSFIAAIGVASAGEAWGNYVSATYEVLQEYEPADTIRRKATWMGWGDYYPEINKAEGGLRIGDGDGEYNNDRNANTILNIKKGVTGNQKDNDAINTRNSGLDNYVLRYAEVLLNYADAVLGNNAGTADAKALEYFNAVRTRAGMPSKSSIAYEDLRHERRIEFCLEGRYWFELTARAYYKQQEVINYLNTQNRGTDYGYLFYPPNDLQADPDRNVNRAVGTATAATFKLPYPESELIQNPKLGDAPVPYEFTEAKITDLF